MAMTLAQVNALSPEDFVAGFGDIAEHTPWVAERAATSRPFASRAAMVEAFQAAVAQAPEAELLALLRAHPDLAGRAAIAGELGAESTSEQAGAGLDTLTPEEFERFTALNGAYTARFGFPFILAVRGAGKHQILAAFETRVGGTRREELMTATAQVLRIIRFRLEDRVAG
jgi:2-oxo-4-hydroxy-4-carboxy-5-ureidoimidazoline decarboxylase